MNKIASSFDSFFKLNTMMLSAVYESYAAGQGMFLQRI